MGAHRLIVKFKSTIHPAAPPLLLLLFALSTVFLFGNDRSHFYRGVQHDHLSSQSMVLAANLSPKHHFLMFLRQAPGPNNTRIYEPYNRFPIGTYALIKLFILPFQESLEQQIYAARILMLSCFAATAVLAYYSLCRLVSNRWVSLAATLLSFSSTYCLYYNDVISTEIISFFGVLLVFHGIVVFVQERRFRQLVAKACIAFLLGWHVFSLLIPFVALGLIKGASHGNKPTATPLASILAVIRTQHPVLGAFALLLSLSFIVFNFTSEYFLTHDGNSLTHFLRIYILIIPIVASGFVAIGLTRRSLKRSLSVLVSNHYLLLTIVTLAFGVLVLAFNITNEYFALEGETSLVNLPTLQSISWRLGLDPPEHYSGWGNRLDWFPYLQSQLSRIGVASVPFSLPGFTSVFEVGYGQASNGTISLVIGTGVFCVGLIGLIFAREKFLLATLMLSGIGWGLIVRHSSYVHDFESIFYIGITLTSFSLILLYIKRLSSNSFLVSIATVSLLIFTLSSFQMGRIGHGPEAATFHERLIADFESIRRMTGSKRVLVLALERNTPFRWGHHAVNYYLAGSIIGYERDGYELADYDFVITSKREEGHSLLTPENRYVFLYATAAPRGG